jgi:branched-chain amino acid transport system permease protein
MDISLVIQAVCTGLLLGGVYGLLSMGLSIIYGVLRVINFAQGDFMMLGMYAAFFIFSFTSIDPILTFGLVFPLFFLFGIGIYKVVMSHVVFQRVKTSQLLMTFGMSFVIVNMAMAIFTPNFRNIFSQYRSSSLDIGPIQLNQAQTIGFIMSIATAIVLSLFLSRLRIGKTIRAVVDDKNTAALLGINVDRVYAITFGIGIALAALAGAALALYYPVFPDVGRNFQIVMFLAVMLGGLGKIRGSLLGGIVVGLIQSVLSLFIPSYLELLPVFVFFFIALVVKPEGLLGGH